MTATIRIAIRAAIRTAIAIGAATAIRIAIRAAIRTATAIGLPTEAFRAVYDEPETVPVGRVDGQPRSCHVPPAAVLPLYLGKKVNEFSLEDANKLVLGDFGEAFQPAIERRLGRDCYISIDKRPPEAFFEPDGPLSFHSDIWSLGIAIWDIVGMKPIFCEPTSVNNSLIAEQIDVLGARSFPKRWRDTWELVDTPARKSELPCKPTEVASAWPSLEDVFEECVQQYRKECG